MNKVFTLGILLCILNLTVCSQNSYKKGWSIIDEKGNVLAHLENNYDSIGVFHNGFAFVSIGDKKSYINSNGEEVSLAKEKELIILHNKNSLTPNSSNKEPHFDYYTTEYVKYSPKKTANKWYFYSKNGMETLTNYQITSVYFSEGLAAVKINNKWGFVNESNTIVIKPMYDIQRHELEFFYSDISRYKNMGFVAFSEGLCPVTVNDSLYYINTKGEKIFSFPPQTYGYNFSEERAIIEKYFVNEGGRHRLKNQYLIDKQGEIIKELPNYEDIGKFSEGLAYVIKDFTEYGSPDANWRYINKDGEEIISLSLKYDDKAYDFLNGLAKIKSNGKYGFIDKTGKEVIIPKYRDIEKIKNSDEEFGLERFDFTTFYIGEMDNEQFDIINPKTQKVIATCAHKPFHISQNGEKSIILIIRNKNDMYYFSLIDENGNELASINESFCQIAQSKTEEILMIIDCDNVKMGLMSINGKIICHPKYDRIDDFQKGLARVLINGKYGFINTVGEEVIPPLFDECSDFSKEGIATIKLNH